MKHRGNGRAFVVALIGFLALLIIGSCTTFAPAAMSVKDTRDYATSCQERWVCTDWTACEKTMQFRECKDVNSCESSVFKPVERRECLDCARSDTCDEWGECVNGIQERFCVSTTYCGLRSEQRTETQECERIEDNPRNDEEPPENEDLTIMDGEMCGNGACDKDEDHLNCPEDCPPYIWGYKGIFTMDECAEGGEPYERMAECSNNAAEYGFTGLQFYDPGNSREMLDPTHVSGQTLRANKQKLWVTLPYHGGVLEEDISDTATTLSFIGKASTTFGWFINSQYDDPSYKTLWLDDECMQFSILPEAEPFSAHGSTYYRFTFSNVIRGCEGTAPETHAIGSVPVNKERLIEEMEYLSQDTIKDAILAYYSIDDPPAFYFETDYRGLAQIVESVVRAYDADTTRPIIYAIGSSMLAESLWLLPGTVDYTHQDQLAMYVYPWRVGGSYPERIENNYATVAQYSAPDGIDIEPVVQAFEWGDFRLPTAEEMRQEINLHKWLGAKNLMFYTYSDVRENTLDYQNGLTMEDWKSLIVEQRLGDLRASFSATVSETHEVLFDASESTPGRGPILEYEWDFGDGTQGSGMIISHLYANPGTYTVTLTIRNDYVGDITSLTRQVGSGMSSICGNGICESGEDEFTCIQDCCPSDIDVDIDGLPDNWELSSFGSLIYGFTDDPDGDEMHNYDEYLSHNDPLDSDSDEDGLQDDDAGIIRPEYEFPVPYSLSVSDNGRITITVNGNTVHLDSYYYHPRIEAAHPRNHLGNPIPGSAEPTWAVTITGDENHRTVIGEGTYYRIERTIDILTDRISVEDRITNKMSEDVGIPFYIDVNAQAPWLNYYYSGYPNASTIDPGNPTTFVSFSNAGLGIYVKDDVFRTQVGGGRNPNLWDRFMRINNEYFGLGAQDTYTVVWEIYPLSSPDYYDFINVLRYHINFNYPIQNMVALGYPSPNSWANKEIPERTLLFDSLSTEQALSQPSSSRHGPALWEPEVPADIASFIQNIFIGKVDETGLDIKQLLYIDLFLSSETDTEQYPDSKIINEQGEHAAYTTGVYGYFPTTTNSFGQKMQEFKTEYIDRFNLDGIYFDESTHSISRFTYAPEYWDGHSFQNNPVEGAIVKRIGNIILLSNDYRVNYVTELLGENLNAAANYPPITRSFSALPIERFGEVGCLNYANTLSRMHLTSPIIYNTDEVNDDSRYIHAALHFGGLHYFSTQHISELYQQSDIYQRIYPITPIAIYDGTIIGDTRIITSKRGYFGWGDTSGMTIHTYAWNGVPSPIPTEIVTMNGASYVHIQSNPGIVIIERSSGCGNGVCDAFESHSTCPTDCEPICGDSICSIAETPETCQADCPTVCGDEYCINPEDYASCPHDCTLQCGDGICEVGETTWNCEADCPVDVYIEQRLAEAEQKEDMRDTVIALRESQQPWNDGEDYGPTLRAMIAALPPSGGVITIPPGRYYLSTYTSINKDNVIIKSGELGQVILEAHGIGDDMIEVLERNGVKFQNIIFYGDKDKDHVGLYMRGRNLEVSNSVFINFDWSFYVSATASYTSKHINVTGNYFFDNNYYTLRVGGARFPALPSCERKLENITISGNYLSGTYQGINLLCVFNATIYNNIARNVNISGVRVETSQGVRIIHNLFFENHLVGINLYGYTYNATLIDNIAIDNNKLDRPYYYDCWSPQQSIEDDYMDNRPGFVHYPYLRTENGYPIFTNYWCQSNGMEVELRNNQVNHTFYHNIIGRYESIYTSTPYDMRISYYPQMYEVRSMYLSEKNYFIENYFINSGPERIKDQACDDVYVGNKIVTFTPYEITDLEFTPPGQILCEFERPCTGPATRCDVCDEDGTCEYVDGENNNNCEVDCPDIPYGGLGQRRFNDNCAPGLTKTELIFPARPGCINYYDGSFYCTACGNGNCEPHETNCNCPNDCPAYCGDLLCGEGEKLANCPQDCAEGDISFQIMLQNRDTLIYSPDTIPAQFDDDYVTAIISGSDGIYTLSLTPKVPIRSVWFPYEEDERILDPYGSEGNIIQMVRLGIAHRVADLDDEWLGSVRGFNATYPGQVSAPILIHYNENKARMVAAQNWPPKPVTPLYRKNRMALQYNFTHHVGTSYQYSALIRNYNMNAGIAAWQAAADDYKRWLVPNMNSAGLWPIEYPSWMQSANGWIHVPLEMMPQPAADPSLNDVPFDAAELLQRWDLWNDYLPMVQMWGQMSGWRNYYYQDNTPGTGCCLMNRHIHERYLSETTDDLLDFMQTVRNQGGHASFYQRPIYTSQYVPLDDPQTITAPDDGTSETSRQWLETWMQRTTQWGANAYYLDVVGAVYLGDPLWMAQQFLAQTPSHIFPEGNVIEWPVDIYPTAYLTGGSFEGNSHQILGGPGISPGDYENTTFPNVGRYLFDDRIMFIGESNWDHYLWGTVKTMVGTNRALVWDYFLPYCTPEPDLCWYWLERQAFLFGGKFDAWHIEDRYDTPTVLDKIMNRTIEQWDALEWWEREPRYYDTRGISFVSDETMDIRRFVDKNGVHLFTIDNPLKHTEVTIRFHGSMIPITIPDHPGTEEPYEVYIYEASIIPPECDPDIILFPWSSCSNGWMNRSYQDLSGCGGAMPATEQDCSVCGDNVCNGAETHASCPADCLCGNGVCDPLETNALCPADCPAPGGDGDDDSGGGGSGGGGGGGIGGWIPPTPTTTPTCVFNWTCTSWTTCIDGNQTRTCTDSNHCQIGGEVRIEWQSCSGGNVTDTCINGVQDGDEEGIDCGGSCPAPCEQMPLSWNLPVIEVSTTSVYLIPAAIGLCLFAAIILLVIAFHSHKAEKIEHQLIMSELDLYMRKMRSRGFSEKSIRDELHRTGWTDDAIRDQLKRT